jgi:hypothetical protein
MTSTAGSWRADVVGMAAFGRRLRLGAGGSATLRGSLSVDTLCLHDGRLPCYDNRKHGPERADLERMGVERRWCRRVRASGTVCLRRPALLWEEAERES